MSIADWLADRLTRLAARRLGRRHPDWAQAMLSEHDHIAGQPDRLGWALGAARASLAAAPPDRLYALALVLAVAAMTLYQWSADEGPVTLALLAALGLGLGFLRPGHFRLSGLAVGLVVAGVNAFESLSGVRPAYEVYPRTLDNTLPWLGLVVPALISAAAGRQIGRRLLA